jgi:hypothetical protein
VHQPWASLVIAGVKRLEGRSWSTDFHGCLFIHAAAETPDPEEIEALEDQYRLIYAQEGINEDNGLKFPETYPTRCLLGCVDVVACVSSQDLLRLNLTASQRMVAPKIEIVGSSLYLHRSIILLEKESDAGFVFLCQNPRRLVLYLKCRQNHRDAFPARQLPRCRSLFVEAWSENQRYGDWRRAICTDSLRR